MERKQQVGECWVGVIFFACVCVWGGGGGGCIIFDDCVSQSLPSSVVCVMCMRHFLWGSQGGQDPLGYAEHLGQRPKFYF
jgi:hypothetical protein